MCQLYFLPFCHLPVRGRLVWDYDYNSSSKLNSIGEITRMAKLIPAAERLIRARKLIQQARALPVPTEGLGKNDFSYIADIRDLMRQAKDMVKFIPQTAGVSADMKEEVKKVYAEVEQAEKEILS